MTETETSPPEPAHLRRAPRPRGRWLLLILLGSLLGLLLFLSALAALALAWLDTPAGQAWLVARLNRELAAQGVEIGGLRGRLLGGWELERFTLSDEEGPYLRLEEIELQWRPLSLLQGEIAIDKLAVAAGELSRLPQDSSPDAADADAAALPRLPRLPMRVTLSRFVVERFAVGEPVLGVAAEMAATGEARWLEEERLRADFLLTRLDRAGDRLEARLDYDQPAATLSLETVLEGAADGVFAAALGARAGETVSLRLSGEGPLAAWQGELAANIGERARLDADIAARNGRVELEGQADAAGLLSSPYADFLRPEVSFRLAGALDRGDALPLEISLETEHLAVQSQGRMALDDRASLDFAYRLDIGGSTPLAPLLGGLGFAAGEVSGRISGAMAAPEITAQARLESPAIPDLGSAESAEVSLRARLGADSLAIAAEGRLAALRLDNQPVLDPIFSVTGSYATAAGSLAIDTAQVSAGGATMTASGGLGDDFETVELDGDVEISSLDSLAFLPDLPLSGGFAATLRVARASGDAPWNLRLDGAGRNIAAASEGLSQSLGPQPEISLAAQMTPDDRLVIEPLQVRVAAGLLEARGPVDLAAGRLDLGYELTVETFAAMLGAQTVSDGDGLVIAGRLFGPFADLETQARTQIAHLELQGVDLADVTAEVSARALTERLQANLELAADSRFGAVDLSAAANLPPAGGVDISALRLSVGTAEIDGRLAIGEDGLLRGAFEGRTGSLAELPESRRYGLRGTLSTRVALSVTDAGKQRITASASAADLILPIGANQVAEVESFDFSGGATLLEPRPRLEAQLDAKDLRVGFSRLAAVSLTASGDRDAMEVELVADGEWRGPLDLKGRLVWRGDEEESFALAADGTIFGQKIAFVEPARLLIANDGWRLDPARFTIGDGQMSATASRGGRELGIDIVAEGLPLELVNVAVPDLYPSGALGAELHLAQAGEAVNGTARVSLRNVEPAVTGFARTPPFDFDIAAELDEAVVALEGSARAEDTLDARISAELPLALDLIKGTAGLRMDDPLAGRFHWQGALAPLFMVVNLPQHEAYGDFTADLTLGGTPSEPELGGTLEIADARYEHLESGFVARNLDLAAVLENRRVTLTRLTADDGDGGTLSGRGMVEFAPEAVIAEAELELSKLHVLQRSDLKAIASGQVAFTKTAETMRASGRLAPDRVELDIGQSLPQDVVDIEVIEVETEEDIVDGGGAPETRTEQPLHLNVTIEAPQRLFVRGRGLDSEWAANLRVTGTNETPRIQGTASVVKGVFEFAGRRFTIQAGELLFVGGETIDPSLNVTARETVDELQITLQISGTLSSPGLSLSSTPSLPEDEILARILFGESVAGLSALQLVQLASTVGSLSGGGGFDVIGGARSLLGLDRLNISAGDGGENGNGGATIAGGKYLTDDVYLEMSTETGTGITAGTLEWGLTKNLSLESRVSSGRDNSIRLRWSWNY